jgi:hypothetical protein
MVFMFPILSMACSRRVGKEMLFKVFLFRPAPKFDVQIALPLVSRSRHAANQYTIQQTLFSDLFFAFCCCSLLPEAQFSLYRMRRLPFFGRSQHRPVRGRFPADDVVFISLMRM